MRGLLRLPITYCITRFKSPTSEGWMPGTWTELECKSEDLSPRFAAATTKYRQLFQQLGFSEVGFARATRSLNPGHVENGAIRLLDAERRHFGLVVFVRFKIGPPINTITEHITTVFTAVFSRGTLSFTNTNIGFDSCSTQTVFRHPGCDATELYQRFLEGIKRRREQPVQFPTLDSLKQWFDLHTREGFEERVRRGLYVRMTDEEVEIASRKLAQAHQ